MVANSILDDLYNEVAKTFKNENLRDFIVYGISEAMDRDAELAQLKPTALIEKFFDGEI